MGIGYMSCFAGLNIVEDGLRISFDASNLKSYPGTGNTMFSLNDTRSVDDYTDLTQIQINHSTNNSVYMGPFYFYDRILSDLEFKQNFDALRGRFGL